MALENPNYFGDLNPSNPASADPKNQGDDHIRNLKKAARQSFPGFTGTIMVGGTTTGAADAYMLSPTTPLLAYTANTMILFKPNITNASSAPYINISSLGDRSIMDCAGNSLLPGDLLAGQYVAMVYDGAVFRLLGVTKNYVDQKSFNTALPAQPGGTPTYELTSAGGAAAWQRADIYALADRLAQSYAIALAI